MVLPFQRNVSRLKVNAIKERSMKRMDNIQRNDWWKEYKSNVYVISKDVLTLMERKYQDWFDENGEAGKMLLNEMNIAQMSDCKRDRNK